MKTQTSNPFYALKYARGLFILCFSIIYHLGFGQTSPANLPQLGIGLGEITYYLPYHPFTDAVKAVRWIDVASWDAHGFPASANAGTTVSGRIGGGTNDSSLDDGLYVLTWEGNGDVTSIGTLVSEDLNATPRRRVYDITTNGESIRIQINSFPATNIKLWIPGQENSASMWNPDYLCYMNSFTGGVFRFMNMEKSNESAQENWSDRTPKNWSTYVNKNNRSASYSVKGAVAYEAMIELANEMQTDMWICIPHLVTDEYITNLSHLIKTGVDLSTGQQTTQPLDSNLAVWLEYSNEVWNTSFSQTSWVNANLPGSNLDEKYALKAVDMFTTFKNQFNDDNRIIRVLATHTVNGDRTRNRLTAVDRSAYDVLAITTYFRYDYHKYIYSNWNNGALTHEDFYNHIVGQMGSGVFQDDGTPDSGTARTYAEAALLNVPVVTYEGNEHFNMVRRVDTNNDGGADTQIQDAAPGSLTWMHDFARSDYMYNLLERYQLRHEASGLKTHVPYVAVSGWSQYGQWGYAEYMGQPLSEATKYRWLHDHFGLNYPCADVVSYLNISPASVDLEYLLQDTTINVSANISWTASTDQSWITLNPDNGSADGLITMSVSENTSSSSRAGTVTFTGPGVANKSLSVSQQGAPGCMIDFTETFDNTTLISRYTYNNFIGVNNIEWTYVKGLTGDEITVGDSNTIRLDKNGTGALSATIPNGISSISAVCKKAGGAGNGALDMKVNGVVIASYFSTGNDIITIAATDLNAGVDDVVEFVTTGVKPIIIDDITITTCSGSTLLATGLKVASPSGTVNDLQSSYFTIYPNPDSNGSIRIETNGFERPTLQIFKMTAGKAIYTKENLPESYTINTGNFLEAGVYVVRIADGKTVKTSKLIVD